MKIIQCDSIEAWEQEWWLATEQHSINDSLRKWAHCKTVVWGESLLSLCLPFVPSLPFFVLFSVEDDAARRPLQRSILWSRLSQLQGSGASKFMCIISGIVCGSSPKLFKWTTQYLYALQHYSEKPSKQSAIPGGAYVTYTKESRTCSTSVRNKITYE